MGNCLVNYHFKIQKNGGVEDERNEAVDDRSIACGGQIVTPKNFTLQELRSVTRNFSTNMLIGEGDFGRVYKGWINNDNFKGSRVNDRICVAVKRCSPKSRHDFTEWKSEVEFLGKYGHPNLLKLLGYCKDDDEYLLVYEFMRKGPQPLPWEIRLKIMIGAARGLCFLHTTTKSVVYRYFNSSNILLDEDYNAKLSDFGLGRLGQPIVKESGCSPLGTLDYAAPEYTTTGHLYVKSDVYSFGVVLLEVLTGLMVYDQNRLNEKNFVVFAKKSPSDEKKLQKIMDGRLEGRYSSTSAFQIAQLILKCLECNPKNRPAMEQVLKTLENAQ